MSRDIHCCLKNESGAAAATKMKEFDIGFMPIVDEQNYVAGVVTDRDIVMYQASNRTTLNEIRATAFTKSKPLYTCKPEDDIQEALDLMREHQLHRLPVVNSFGKLQGVIGLADIVQHTDHGSKYFISADEALETVKGIYSPR